MTKAKAETKESNMKSISLKLEDQILKQLQYQKRKLIEEQLIKESKLVGEDSMKILKEFESLEDEI